MILSSDIKLLVTNYLSDYYTGQYLATDKHSYKLIKKYILKSYYDFAIYLGRGLQARLTKVISSRFRFQNYNKITHVIFNNCFNKPVDDLPLNLTHLKFGKNFNQPVDNLPLNLTHLTFGRKFNQKVDKLPSSLKYLTFGECFEHKINNLPPNITHLKFGFWFNQNIDQLPISLIDLCLGVCFHSEISNFPPNLKYLTLAINYTDKWPKIWPESLQDIITKKGLHIYLSKHM